MTILRLHIRCLLVLLLAGGGVLHFHRAARAQLPSGTNWALTFADEFNGSTLDSMKWSNGHPWDPGSSLASNVTVGGGDLNLNAVRVNSTTFTRAGVSTENSSYNELFGLTYGYVEARMKMPSLPGSWPAFWMLESGWPPELDINEFPVFVDGTFSPYNYSDNIHYTNSSGGNSSLGNGVHYAGVGDLTAGFHNYGMRWTPSSVAFYCDGNVQSTITDSTAIANLIKSGGGPMYILLDNSGGGSWPGVPSESQWPDGATSTVQVDWVRVWKDTSGSAASITWNNTASNGSGSWTNASVWSGGQVPQLSSQTAVFPANAVNNQTVTWNYSQTIGSLTFNSSTSYTLGSAGGSLMLANTGGTSLIDATGASGNGANYLNSRLELYNNVTMQTSSKPLIVNGALIGTGNLTIAAGAVTLAGDSTTTGQITVSAGAGRSAVLNIVPGSLIEANYTSAPSLAVATATGGTATINMSGGTLNTASELWLSSANGAKGTMNVSGGVANIGSWLAVGRGGDSGTLNVSGGSLNVAANNLTIGSFGGNQGQVNVSGGTLNAVNAIYDGESGTGAMTLSRSGVITATSLYIGLNNGAIGTYTQTGGLLAAQGTAYNQINGVGVVVGSVAGSSGTLNISGGTISGPAPIMVWAGSGSINVSQTGSTPTLVRAGWITLGQVPGAVGTITQSGGAVATNSDNFYIGWGAGTTGNYIMHGGSMTVGDIRTDNGTGNIYQDGGAVTPLAPAWVRLGISASAVSTYTLAGGTLSVSGGRVNVAENGTGTLTIGGSNGGTMLVSPSTSLTIAYGAGSGTLNLQTGGLLRTPDVAAGGGAAAFNFSGGTLQDAVSGNLSVATPVNLSGPGMVDIDSGHAGVFTTQAPIRGSGSLYKLGGGTLTLSGSGAYSGGTNVFGGELIASSPLGLKDGSNLFVGSAGSVFAPPVPSFDGGTSAASAVAAVAPVPEPGTMALLAAGAAATVAALRQRSRHRLSHNSAAHVERAMWVPLREDPERVFEAATGAVARSGRAREKIACLNVEGSVFETRFRGPIFDSFP